MEQNAERVLAYTKATVIDNAQLKEVSGGWSWTNRLTAGGSGGSGEPREAHVDVVVDY